MSSCNMDCFRCPFDDCINDELTYQEIKQSEDLDREISGKPIKKSKKYDREKGRAYNKFLNERARFELLRDQWKL